MLVGCYSLYRHLSSRAPCRKAPVLNEEPCVIQYAEALHLFATEPLLAMRIDASENPDVFYQYSHLSVGYVVWIIF